jgi:hypothetical protein
VDRDQITSAYVGISKLMNIRDGGAGDRTFRTLATAVVTQTLFFIEAKDRFLHQALVNANDSMRTVVVMNRRLLSGPPTNDQHFDRIVPTNPVPPVIAFLESEIRLQFELGDLDCRKPGAYFFERGRGCLLVQFLDQLSKR